MYLHACMYVCLYVNVGTYVYVYMHVPICIVRWIFIHNCNDTLGYLQGYLKNDIFIFNKSGFGLKIYCVLTLTVCVYKVPLFDSGY